MPILQRCEHSRLARDLRPGERSWYARKSKQRQSRFLKLTSRPLARSQSSAGYPRTRQHPRSRCGPSGRILSIHESRRRLCNLADFAYRLLDRVSLHQLFAARCAASGRSFAFCHRLAGGNCYQPLPAREEKSGHSKRQGTFRFSTFQFPRFGFKTSESLTWTTDPKDASSRRIPRSRNGTSRAGSPKNLPVHPTRIATLEIGEEVSPSESPASLRADSKNVDS